MYLRCPVGNRTWQTSHLLGWFEILVRYIAAKDCKGTINSMMLQHGATQQRKQTPVGSAVQETVVTPFWIFLGMVTIKLHTKHGTGMAWHERLCIPLSFCYQVFQDLVYCLSTCLWSAGMRMMMRTAASSDMNLIAPMDPAQLSTVAAHRKSTVFFNRLSFALRLPSSDSESSSYEISSLAAESDASGSGSDDGGTNVVDLTLDRLQSLHAGGSVDKAYLSEYAQKGMSGKRVKKSLQKPCCSCRCRMPVMLLHKICVAFWTLCKQSQDSLLWEIQQCPKKKRWYMAGPEYEQKSCCVLINLCLSNKEIHK